MQKIGVVAQFEGVRIAFPVSFGYGLVALPDSSMILLRFKTLLEGSPPKGVAERVGVGARLVLEEGSLWFNESSRVYLGEILPENG